MSIRPVGRYSRSIPFGRADRPSHRSLCREPKRRGNTPAFTYATNATSNDISAYSIAPATGVLTPVSGGPFPAGGFPFGVASDVEGISYLPATTVGAAC